MFCKECGHSMPDDAIFCENCGAKVEQATQNSAPDNQPTHENVTVTPAKSKLPKKPVIIAGAAAAIVVLGLVLINPIKNAFVKLSSPEKYLEHAVSASLDDYADTAAEYVGIYKELFSKGIGSKGKIKVEIGKDLLNTLEDASDMDMDWLKKMELSYTSSQKMLNNATAFSLNVNGADFGKIDIIIDNENGDTFIGLPKYNKEYFAISNGYGYEEYEEVLDVLEALPSEKETAKLLKKYISVIAGSIKDVEKSTDTIDAGDLSKKVTVLTVDLDGKNLKNAGLTLLNELKKDKDLKKVVKNFANAIDADEDEFWEGIDSAIEDLEDLDEDDLDTDTKIEFYVDGSNKLVGFEFKLDDGKISFCDVVKGGKFATSFRVSAGYNDIKFVGEGKISGDKRTGEYALKVSGVEVVEFEVDSLNTKLLKDGVLNGTITIKLSDSATSMIARELGYYSLPFDLEDLSVVIKSKAKSKTNANATISLNDGKNALITIESSANETKPTKIVAPKNYTDDFEEWGEGFNVKELTKAMKKAKFPDDLIDVVEESLDY